MPIILDGAITAKAYKDSMKEELISLNKDTKPTLLVFLVGDDVASGIYVANKVKACEYVGFESIVHHLPNSISEEDLLQKIHTANEDNAVNAILVQLPLPKHINVHTVLESISPDKDADGLHPCNLGKVVQGIPTVAPCTPRGILRLLEHYQITISGKHVVIVGRSIIVGKTMSLLLLNNGSMGNATVTVCHSKTRHVEEYTKQADILISAIGKARYITEDMVKEDSVIVDVGINTTEQGLCGDCDYKAILPKVYAITPVPKGVGPMTICELLANTLYLWKKQKAIL